MGADTQRRSGHMKPEAEPGVSPVDKECLTLASRSWNWQKAKRLRGGGGVLANALISEFWPPDLWETKFCIKPPSLGYLVMAALGNTYGVEGDLAVQGILDQILACPWWSTPWESGTEMPHCVCNLKWMWVISIVYIENLKFGRSWISLKILWVPLSKQGECTQRHNNILHWILWHSQSL